MNQELKEAVDKLAEAATPHIANVITLLVKQGVKALVAKATK